MTGSQGRNHGDPRGHGGSGIRRIVDRAGDGQRGLRLGLGQLAAPAQCTTTFGGVAVALDDTSTASATGGLFNTAIAGGGNATATAAGPALNTAIALGERADATAVGIGNTALALGKNTTALAAGTFNLAADIGENEILGEREYADEGHWVRYRCWHVQPRHQRGQQQQVHRDPTPARSRRSTR